MEGVGENPVFVSTLVSRHVLAPGILEVRMRRPAGFSFMPGQFVRFIMDGYRRDYTIVSDLNAATIDFCIAIVEDGRFSDIIGKADAGDRFQLSGPHGHFVFRESGRRPVFVATGTGVAPFVAFCRSKRPDALLLHGVSGPDQLIYRNLLESRLQTYVPCISGSYDTRGDIHGAFAGRVTTYIEKILALAVYDFYLCGQRDMIRDVTALIDDRFDGSRLFIENFD